MGARPVICDLCGLPLGVRVFELNGVKTYLHARHDHCELGRRGLAEASYRLDRRVAEAYRGVSINYRDKIFTTFDSRKQTAAYQRCYDFGTAIGDRSSNRGLFLMGSPGTGKTHLLCAIANRLLSRGVACRVLRFGPWVKSLITDFSDEDQAAEIRFAKRCPVLLVDDFGSEKMSEWAESLVYEVVDARIEAGLPIVWTTNLDKAGLHQSISPRILSRIRGSVDVVVVNGADYRVEGDR